MTYIPIGNQIQLGRKTASIDAKYGPYASLQAAQEILGENGMDVITVGLTVGIVEDGNIVEYWWQGGTALSNLVKKFEKALNPVDLKNLTTGNTIPYTATESLFLYDGEAVNAFSCVHDGANCILVHANIYKNEQTINKVFLIAGRTILGAWNYDNRPAWTDSYIVSAVAGKVSDIYDAIKWK